MKTWTTILAGACMTAMVGAAGAAGSTDAAKSEHASRPMTTHECSAYMAQQARPHAATDEKAKQDEAYCARKLQRTIAWQDSGHAMKQAGKSKL